MGRNIFLTLYVVFCLLVPSCGTEQVAPSPNVKPVAIISADNTDQITQQSILGLGKITSGEFSPDGKHFGVITPLGVYIYNAETLKSEEFLHGGSPTSAAAFSFDWSLLALGTDATITVQRLVDHRIVAQLEAQPSKVTRLMFSPDGSLLASFITPPGDEVYTQTVELWQLSDGKRLNTWSVSVYDQVFFAPDGKTFYAWNVSQSLGMRRWQIPSGIQLPSWKNLNPYPSILAFSPVGNTYASTSANAILLERMSDQTLVAKLMISDSESVSLLQFSPDGSLVAALLNNGMVKVWHINDGALLGSFEAESAVNLFLAFSPDNKFLAIPTLEGVAFYNLADGSLLRRLENYLNAIQQAVLSPQGNKVAALVEGDGLMVWDLLKGKMAYSLSKVGGIDLAWSPDGQWLVLGGWDDSLRVLHAEDGKLIRSIPTHTAQIQSVAFSPDGTLLAASSMDTVRLWQFKDGSLIHNFGVGGGWVAKVRFSPDGKYLAATSAAGMVEVWRVSDGQQMTEFPVPDLSGDRDVIDFASDSSYIAIAEMSQIVLWRYTDEKPFQLLPIRDQKITTLRISPDGSLLVCGLTDGTIQLWQIPEGNF